MSMHKSMCNSTNTTGPASCEQNVKTLGDYITKVMNEEAFLNQKKNVLNQKKKLTFEEWLAIYNQTHGMPPAWVVAKDAWEAGQANK